ncbi:MAG TPA: PAS domain-containing protein [Terriglobales bacterium]
MPPKTPANDSQHLRQSLCNSLDQILITSDLGTRPLRWPMLEKESRALNALARIMADEPLQLVDTLLQTALELCHADTAGLSVLETTADGEQVFRWTHLAGVLKDYVGGATPRNHSPCGVTLDRNAPQLFKYPGRYFHYFNDVSTPIVEGLVIPLVGENPSGTIWIVSHNDRTRFDMEDVRIMTSLAAFTGSALRMIHLLESERTARHNAEEEAANRKRTEITLRESEEFTRRILDSSSDCIKVLDLDFHLKYISPFGMKLMEVDDFSHCENADWRSFWQEADRPAVLAAVEQALAGGIGTFHAFCPTMKGTPKWWDVVVTAMKDGEGRVVKLLSSSRDVTERKRMELQQQQSIEKFETLADSMPQMIWTARPDGFLDYYNQRWFDYTGLTLKETQGWGWKQTQHPEDVQGTVDKWMISLATGEPFENEMRFLRASDQTWRWHFTRAVAVRGEHGKVVQWVGTCTDIHDRKNAEESLRQAQAELEERVERRTAQLRQEVTVRRQAEQDLRTLTGRLLTLRDAEQRRIARDLHDSAGQLLTATSMSLALVTNEASKIGPDAVEALAEATQLVQETIKEVRIVSHLLHPPLLDEAGLPSAIKEYVEGFSQRGDVKVDLFVRDDFGRLPIELETTVFRVIQECLTNIHRHSGSPTARVTLRRLPQEVQIEVADKGKGFAAEKPPGVGLRGMRERIGQFGGELEIHSDNSGTTISARLPLAKTSIQRRTA